MLDAAAKSAPAKAVIMASKYVTGRHGVSGLNGVTSRESRRRPGWALVTGRYRRPSPGGRWAVWLLFYDQRWLVEYGGLDEQAARPPKGSGVPCDIRPAFARPAC